MALERGKLSNVVRVAAGATVGIATCTSSKKVYIKSIIAHAAGLGIATATGQVYFTQAGVTTGVTPKFLMWISLLQETVLIEPSYPIVLAENGDTLAVGTGNVTGLAATHVNFMITGDKESLIYESIKVITRKNCR